MSCVFSFRQSFYFLQIKRMLKPLKLRVLSYSGYYHTLGIIIFWVLSYAGYYHILGIIIFWVLSYCYSLTVIHSLQLDERWSSNNLTTAKGHMHAHTHTIMHTHMHEHKNTNPHMHTNTHMPQWFDYHRSDLNK